MSADPPKPVFSLADAQALLPAVKRITAEAVRRAEAIMSSLRELSDQQPEHARLAAELETVLRGWAAEIRELGAEAKGLWLVDFDSGDGYYCWAYPEEAITHYHGYTDGFAGRMKIL